MKRKDFIRSAYALAMTSLADKCVLGQDHAPTGILDYDLRQKEIDEVLPNVFTQYYKSGLDIKSAELSEIECKYPVIGTSEVRP